MFLPAFGNQVRKFFLLLLYEVFTMIADLPDDFFSVLADEITGTQTETERQEGVSDQADNEADRKQFIDAQSIYLIGADNLNRCF